MTELSIEEEVINYSKIAVFKAYIYNFSGIGVLPYIQTYRQKKIQRKEDILRKLEVVARE